MMSIVTRFPPSPTGFLHIGGARTALFNWLYAKNMGGKFLLRIEDTDRARHSDDAVTAIIRAMTWLGLDWESDHKNTQIEDQDIYSQFAARDRHTAVAKELVTAGKAYYCYCSKEELEEMRTTAKEKGLPTSYDRRWRDKSPKDASEQIAAGIEPVIRIKAPLDGVSIIEDEVQGRIEIDNKQLDDFILLRSDGTPTYMLSVVVDDHDMGVSHIIRGDDHINNAFRQKVLFEAMGWDVPVFAHIPLILGQDGAKLSKRHGAVSAEIYRDMGYLPEAMRNYLLRLGWSHGNDEIIPTQQAIEWFNLGGIGKNPARFDLDKLDSLNQHYMREMKEDDLLEATLPFYSSECGIDNLDQTSKDRILACMDEFKDRAKTLVALAKDSAFFARPIPYSFDEKAQKTLSAEGIHTILGALADKISKLPPGSDADIFTPQTVEEICRTVAADHCGGKLGKVGMPLRCALTGGGSSPSIFAVAAAFGREETLKRLEYSLANL